MSSDVTGRNVNHAVGSSGASLRQRSTLSMRNDEMIQLVIGSARDSSRATTPSATDSDSSKSGSAGSFLISMLTKAPVHASSASPSVSTCPGRSTRWHATISRPSVRRASWLTTMAPSAVRRASSSTPAAPMRTAVVNASRVFSRSARDAPRCAMTFVTSAR